MGIPRLLPAVRSVSRPRNIVDFGGSVVGIDGNVWLYRSIFTDAEKFATGYDGSSHVKYFIRRVQKLLAIGIRPLVVFDGADLPAKFYTHKNRSSNRIVSMGRAVALRESGSTNQSYNLFAKAADLKFQLVRDIMVSLEEEGIEAVVAPYEADAQLSHLSKTGVVDLVVTEDSDLLVYGCTRVLFKWDPVSMFGLEVSGPLNQATPFMGLSSNEAVMACVLAGSDYGPGVRGLGISKALELIRRCPRKVDGESSLEEIIARTSLIKDSELGHQVLENLRMALYVFRHQTIFRVDECRLAPLNPYPGLESVSKYSEYLGRLYDSEHAYSVYRGRLHPVTFAPYSELNQHQLGNIVLNS